MASRSRCGSVRAPLGNRETNLRRMISRDWKIQMTKRKLIALVSCFAMASMLFPVYAQTQNSNASNSIKVSIIRNRSSFDEGGCSLQLPIDYRKHNERFVFLSDF